MIEIRTDEQGIKNGEGRDAKMQRCRTSDRIFHSQHTILNVK
jgi:hypothetical protein